jgi:Xaa-Pro aminopeptidase
VTVAPERGDRLASLVEDNGLGLLLVTKLVNVRYLCGFSGTNGVCLVGPRTRVLVTDFRYTERASEEARGWEVVQGQRDLLGDVARLAVERHDGSPLRLGFDDDDLSVRRHQRLLSLLGDDVELVPEGGLVEQLRAVKDDGELRLMRESAAIANDLYAWLIEEHGLAGHTERDVARALERRAQDSGAEDVSFPPIVAAGANGAQPHASIRDVEIERGTLVVVDLGCLLDGYCSDCTRTFATGSVDGEAREVYELVRRAQAAGVDAVRAGAGRQAIDAAAREEIERAGHGDHFGHGTGHGVGLEVHEEPRLGPGAEGTLAARNVVTVEPGVYLPGRFGVRIEDLVVVTEDGCETLTTVPKDLIEI